MLYFTKFYVILFFEVIRQSARTENGAKRRERGEWHSFRGKLMERDLEKLVFAETFCGGFKK